MSVTVHYDAARDLDEDTWLNFSNRNWASVLQLIGLDPEWTGTWAVTDLPRILARVRFAVQSVEAMPELDGGTESRESRGANGARVIDCGLPEGYYGRRLRDLEALLDAAHERGVAVHWD